MINEGPDKSVLHQTLFTYLGHSPSLEAPLDYSTLTIDNVKHDDIDWLETKITTDAL
jgi:hypothetical protein